MATEAATLLSPTSMPDDCPPEVAKRLIALCVALSHTGTIPDEPSDNLDIEAALAALADAIVALRGRGAVFGARGFWIEHIGTDLKLTHISGTRVVAYTTRTAWEEYDRSSWSLRDQRRYTCANRDAWLWFLYSLPKLIEALRRKQNEITS